MNDALTAATRCRFEGSPAVAIYEMDEGCLCHPEDRQQALCMQHVERANPIGSMIRLTDPDPYTLFRSRWKR
jgi:hypothetical protein